MKVSRCGSETDEAWSVGKFDLGGVLLLILLEVAIYDDDEELWVCCLDNRGGKGRERSRSRDTTRSPSRTPDLLDHHQRRRIHETVKGKKNCFHHHRPSPWRHCAIFLLLKYPLLKTFQGPPRHKLLFDHRRPWDRAICQILTKDLWETEKTERANTSYLDRY